ncbi:MAG TPA: ribonuclease PH, partial [Gallionella sp.]
YVALQDAVSGLMQKGLVLDNPLKDSIAAISVGIYQGTPVLDLDYLEDSACDTDMNVVMLGCGHFVEVQGTAEGHPFTRAEMDELLELAKTGIADLIEMQRTALAE